MFTSEQVKPLREKLKLTQAEFAAKVNAGARSIARYEKGKQVRINAAIRNNMEKLWKKHMKDET